METLTQWWFWFAIGLALMAFELLLPSFFLLWLGLAAMAVGLVVLFADLSPTQLMFLWAIFSAIATALWFKYFKSPDRSKEGLSKEAFVGQTGIVSIEVSSIAKGEIMFQSPVLGADRWPIVADTTIKVGEQARIVDVIGQVLKVEPTGR